MSSEELETARLTLLEADAAAASTRRTIRATSTPLLRPFLGFAIVLVLFGIRDRRPRLVIWTAVLATIGTTENYFGFTNRLPYFAWSESLHNAIMVAVGVLFIAAGLIERRHENRL